MVRVVWSWIFLAAALLSCVAVAYGSSRLAAYSWDQVVSYVSPYSAEPLAEEGPEPGQPLARRVVLVIVDGMRDDITRSAMPGVDRLRQYGADVVLQTAQPSLSYPNWTTILTGAPQTLTGVTTNWWEGRVPVPSLIDQSISAGRRTAVVGPTSFTELYGVKAGPLVSLREWPEGGYLSGTLVDDALRIAGAQEPDMLVVHLPDLDEAGHDFGADSPEYREVAGRVDSDLSRLFSALQSAETVFAIVSDHGHVAQGGHGGWEPEVLNVPFIVSGAGSRLGLQTTGTQDQVASTVAVLAGLRPPAFALGGSVRAALVTDAPGVFAAEEAQRIALLRRIGAVVSGDELKREELDNVTHAMDAVESARDTRLQMEKRARAQNALVVVGLSLVVLVAIAAASWRAFIAATGGTVAYYASYSLLFFGLHGYRWSLSAFNTEEYLGTFFNVRMLESAIAGLLAVGVAAAVYPLLRREPKGPQVRGYLPGWLTLSPATVLVIMATLAMQVAWFLWAYGAKVEWVLPDFKWGFKYDLDLVQMTALGAAAVLGMLVSYLVGRYHPKVLAATTSSER